MRRLQPVFEGLSTVYASVYDDYADDVPGHRFYRISDITRFNPIKLAILIPQLIWILLRERPEVVVTTGSAPGLVAIALAKTLVRAKTIWIDSIANCERLSSSGRQAQRFADLWLTQWPHLATIPGPLYWGAVL